MIYQTLENFYKSHIFENLNSWYTSPLSIITTILDLAIVIFLIYSIFFIDA